jgi:hypothetical protein
MKKWMLVWCLVSAFALAAVTWAEPEGREQGPRPGPEQQPDGRGLRQGGPGGFQEPSREMMLRAVIQNPELAAKVGLKEEQVKAIREAAFAQREQMVTLRSQAELARLQVEKLMAAEPVDKEAVLKAVEAAGQQEIAIKKAEITLQLKLKELVGEEVAKKMRAEMKKHLAERRAAMGPGGEERPGPMEGEMRRPRGEAGQGREKAPLMQEEMRGPKAAPGR